MLISVNKPYLHALAESVADELRVPFRFPVSVFQCAPADDADAGVASDAPADADSDL